MSNPLPHQQRVIEEAKDLAGKIERLTVFTGSVTYGALDEAERERLLRQLGLQHRLHDVLLERIAAFRSC